MTPSSASIGSEALFGFLEVLFFASILALHWRWSALTASWRRSPRPRLRRLLWVFWALLVAISMTVPIANLALVLGHRGAATLWFFCTLWAGWLWPTLDASTAREASTASRAAPDPTDTSSPQAGAPKALWGLWALWGLALAMALATCWALTFWIFPSGPTP
jgi:hypothetical protein